MIRLSYLCIVVVTVALLLSCQESLEEKAEREAREYTERYCPTPVANYTRTDSVVFDKNRRVYQYYISFVGDLDNQEIIDNNKERITNMLTQSITESTGLRGFVEAGFKFEYICHSGRDPKKVMLKVKI